MPIEFFVGKHVMKAFAGTDPKTGKERREHMWVRVSKVDRKGRLVGKLDNDPMLMMPLSCGDRVTLLVTEIEKVYQER